MGRNGMGKTTTVHAIMGLLPAAARHGRVRRRDGSTGWPAFRIARLGLGLVPEGRQIFPNLTVRENLVAAGANRTGRASPWTIARVFEFFPRLAERQRNMGNQLSGGEQQMLAIGRALMTNPQAADPRRGDRGAGAADPAGDLVLSRPAEGRGPGDPGDRQERVGALIRLADRHHIVEKGRVVWTGSSQALAGDKDLQHRYLGV